MALVFPLPSLSTGAAMGTVVHLWNHQLYRNSSANPTKFVTDTSELERNIESLLIATKHKHVILGFLRPLVKYLNSWLGFWNFSLRERQEPLKKWLDKMNLKRNMRITLHGNVDGQATANAILKSGTLSDRDAFRLACINCMLDEIMLLWPRVKSYFINKVYNGNDLDTEPSEVIVFSRYINELNQNDYLNDLLEPYTFRWHESADAWYEFAVRSAAKNDNDVALEYFLQEIDSDLKEKIILGIAESMFNRLDPPNAVSIRLVILQLGLQKWCKFVNTHAVVVFETLIKWPLWVFFSEYALESRRNLSTKDLLDSLFALGSRYHHNYLIDQAVDIFNTVWINTPFEQKIKVIELMVERDIICQIRSSPKLLNIMVGASWVIKEVFIHEEALFQFLNCGFKRNATSLRRLLYEYLPSCKDNEGVENMLSLYEKKSLLII